MLSERAEHPSLELLSDYIHGRLDEDASRPIESHLETCEHCCDALDGLDNTGIVRMFQSVDSRQNETTAPLVTATNATVERYRLEQEIGSGGMGVVYRAFDKQLGRNVAVKTLRRGLTGSSRHRLLREAKITAKLDHPGIPATHELGNFSDGRPFMAMRLVRGETLLDQLKANHDRNAALQVFGRLCDALASAHAKGIIHRDIKPANIMVGAFGEVQLMDWGLAKQTGTSDVAVSATARSQVEPGNDDDTVEISAFKTPTDCEELPLHEEDPSRADHEYATQAGTVLGTSAFMSPEQAAGRSEDLTPASDVFALGAVLCQILTGFPPFVGEDPESTRTLVQAANLEPIRTRLVASQADHKLIQLTLDCLAKQPEQRPADATIVAERFEAWQQGVRQDLDAARIAQAKSETQLLEERKRRRIQVALLFGGLLFAATVWQLNLTLKSQREEFASTQQRLEREQQAKRLAVIRDAEDKLTLFEATLTKATNAAPDQQALWNEARIHLDSASALAAPLKDDAFQQQLTDAESEYEVALEAADADRTLLRQLAEVGGQSTRRGRPPAGNKAPAMGTGQASDGQSEGRTRRRPTRETVREHSAQLASRGHTAFLLYGMDPLTTDASDVAAYLRTRPQPFREMLTRHLEVWFHYSVIGQHPEKKWVLELLSEMDGDPQHRQLREALLRGDIELLQQKIDDVDFLRRPPELIWSIAARLREDNHAAATRLIQQAHVIHSDSAVISWDMAQMLRRTGRNEEASRVLMLRASQFTLESDQAQAMAPVATTLYNAERYRDAALVLQKAIEMDSDAISERQLLDTLAQVDDSQFSADVLSTLLDSGKLNKGASWQVLGDAYMESAAWPEAIEAYQTALSLGSMTIERRHRAKDGLAQAKALEMLLQPAPPAEELEPPHDKPVPSGK